jgi:pimeloyl-ACP methyl ester carboxylesterase
VLSVALPTVAIPKARDVEVGDQRIVGTYEYGDPGGSPVFVLHGTPACGAGFAWADDAARGRGLRLIAPDRPGVGRSTPRPAGRVADYPRQVTELADVLGVGRFAVLGYSGGGPYAAACAAMLSDRVTAVAVASGMGQVGAWATIGDFEKTDRQLLDMVQKRPWLARLMLGVSVRLARLSPKSAVKSFEKELSPADRALVPTLGSPKEVIALFTEAFGRSGTRGVLDDYAAIAQTWGVDVGTIAVPVTIWHGAEDTMVPVRHAEALHALVPNSELVIWPDAGHLGPVAHIGEILDSLR